LFIKIFYLNDEETFILNNSKSPKLNKQTEKRNNHNWIENQLLNDSSLFIPFNESKYLFASSSNNEPIFLTRNYLDENNITIDSYIFLGQSGKASYFTFEVNDEYKKLLFKLGQFEELRKSIPYLTEFEIEVLLHAKAMAYWHSRHKFCGTCGSPTINKEAGNLLVCSNSNCKINHFPRTDPAVIVLVTKDDKCLLGHNKAWVGNRYSTLAGFVEPGESLEDAVRREVYEESGIEVANIQYVSSQPWPFPSSLMLGFTAEALNKDIVIDDHEIEHAAWFTRKEIIDKLKNKTIKMPTKISIAFKLISQWFNNNEGLGKLSEFTNDD